MPQHPHLLPGLWESTGNVRLFEEWWLPDDSTLLGRSFSVNGHDTLLIESMELSLRSGSWTYWASPVNQNEGRAIPFRMTDATDAMVFENPDHDYPNRIIYRLETDTLLFARTENMAGNKPKEFSFQKIGCTRLQSH
ncbi:MAG TPA: DUF6265 family protein [Bacteroidales bacterium]|nr:DUF6265 family protein [Bacteroidales bacterium]